MTSYADFRPDWVGDDRGQCPTCRVWRKVTKAGVMVVHKRQEPGRWHMVPCRGSAAQPLPAKPREVRTGE